MKKLAFWGMLVLLCVFVPVSEGAVFNVSTPTEFQNALTQAETNGEDDVINVLADMTVTSTLTYTGEQGRTLTINGNGHSLDGGGTVQIMNINTTGLTDDTGSDITIQNLTFQNGSTGGSGGGLLVWTNAANITLENNTFSSNTAGSDGGGAHVETDSGTATLTNNTFSGNNSAGWCGGIHVWTGSGSAVLQNNTFSDNSTVNDAGGAGVMTDSGSAVLQNNIFSSNTAGSDGGGAYVETSSGTAVLQNNTFSSNSASWYGGGVEVEISSGTATLTNNTFYGNSANTGGGLSGFLFQDTATLQVYNNIIWGNTANWGGNDGDDIYVDSDTDGNGTGSIVELYNNDLGPNSDFATAQSEDLVITDTDNYTHSGNITDDPLLADPAGGDFHLTQNSPCIDAGDNNAPGLPSTDFEGDQRVLDGNQDGNPVVDIGADEYQPPQQVTTVPTMTQWGMLLFMVLSGTLAVRYMRRIKSLR